MEGPVYPPSPTAKRPTSPWVWVAISCLAFIVVLAVGAGLCFYFGYVKNPELRKSMSSMVEEAQRQTISRDNLQSIGEALQRYAQKNDGEFPENLSDLKKEDYLKDPGILIDPSTGREYHYKRPAKDDPDDTVVITVKSSFPMQMTFKLLKDGTVEEVH
jgi:hypothetical protein